MLRLNSLIQQASDYFINGFRQPASTRIFFKALVVYALVKLILMWPACRMVLQHHTLPLPRSIPGKLFLAPAFLANLYPDVFFSVGAALIVLLIVVKPHIILNLLFFWLTFNLYVVGFPVTDGSDVVLFMLSFWAIPLAHPRSLVSESQLFVRAALFNVGRLFCQFFVVMVYAVSGLDKIRSEGWQTGEAFAYVEHLEFLFNPLFKGIFEYPVWNLLFSWSTLAFELSFCVLIWINKTRLPIIIIGIIFHLFIWIVLSLPDFALIMILSYLIFLRNSDYEKIRSMFRPALP